MNTNQCSGAGGGKKQQGDRRTSSEANKSKNSGELSKESMEPYRSRRRKKRDQSDQKNVSIEDIKRKRELRRSQELVSNPAPNNPPAVDEGTVDGVYEDIVIKNAKNQANDTPANNNVEVDSVFVPSNKK
ncbi:hypothetical protein COOONC_01092 [Cooperia oncophora]